MSRSVDSRSSRALTASRNEPAGAELMVRNSSRTGSNRSNVDCVSLRPRLEERPVEIEVLAEERREVRLQPVKLVERAAVLAKRALQEDRVDGLDDRVEAPGTARSRTAAHALPGGPARRTDGGRPSPRARESSTDRWSGCRGPAPASRGTARASCSARSSLRGRASRRCGCQARGT